MSQCTPEEQWQAENNPLAYLRCLTRGQVIAASVSNFTIIKDLVDRLTERCDLATRRDRIYLPHRRTHRLWVDCCRSSSQMPPTCRSDTLSAQRNVLRYREAAPGGSWRLLKGPADIYLVCIDVYRPGFARDPHMRGAAAGTICIRFFAIDWADVGNSMGVRREGLRRDVLRRDWYDRTPSLSPLPCFSDYRTV